MVTQHEGRASRRWCATGVFLWLLMTLASTRVGRSLAASADAVCLLDLAYRHELESPNQLSSTSTCFIETGEQCEANILVLNRHYANFEFAENECAGFLGWPAVQSTLVLQYARKVTSSTATKSNFRMLDSCSSAVLMSQHIQDELTNIRCRNTTTASGSSSSRSGIDFVLGPALSREVAVASPQFSSKAIAHISHLASSEAFDDVDAYAYLFRTVPSDVYQVQAMADLLAHFNWSYVALVASASLLYGTGGLNGLRREGLLRSNTSKEFCFGVSVTMPLRSDAETVQLKRMIQRIESMPQIRTIVLYVLDEEAVRFLSCLFARNASRYVIVGSEAWTTRVNVSNIQPLCNCSDEDPLQVTRSVPTIIGLAVRTLLDSTFKKRLKVFQTEVLRNATALESFRLVNPWLTQYLQKQESCHYTTGESRKCLVQNTTGWPLCKDEIVLENETAFHSLYPLMYMASVSVKLESNPRSNDSYSAESYACQLRKLRLPCDADVAAYLPEAAKSCSSSGRCSCNAFTRSQSAWPFYTVVHLDEVGIITEIGKWQGVHENKTRLTMDPTNLQMVWPAANTTQSNCRPRCKPGYKRVNSTLQATACCWSCTICRNGHVSPGDTYTCTKCAFGQNGTYTVANVSRCIDAPVNYEAITSSAVISELVACSLFILLQAVTLGVFWRLRDIDLIHRLDMRSTTLILALMTIAQACASIIVLEPTWNQCLLSKLLSAPWMNLCPAILTVRALRLSAIAAKAKEKKVGRMRRWFVGWLGQALGILLVLAASEMIAVLSYCLGGIELQTQANGTSAVLRLCTISSTATAVLYYALMTAMLCVAFVTTLRVRQCRDLVQDNEGLLLFVCSVCLIFICIALEPSFYIASSNVKPHIHFATITSSLLLAWVVLYGSRLFLLFKHRHEL